MKTEVAAVSAGGVTIGGVAMVLSKGSVVVEAAINVPSGTSASGVSSSVNSSASALPSSVISAVQPLSYLFVCDDLLVPSISVCGRGLRRVGLAHAGVAADSPAGGPAGGLRLGVHLERHGGDPRQRLQLFIRQKGLSASVRVVHELRVLGKALYTRGVFDQLDLGGVLVVEVLSRRTAGIVDAYAKPSQPNWEGARYYQGVSSVGNAAWPAVGGYVTRQTEEDYEVEQARSRARGLRGSPEGGSEVEADAAGGGAPGGRDRGQGGGWEARGVPPPGG